MTGIDTRSGATVRLQSIITESLGQDQPLNATRFATDNQADRFKKPDDVDQREQRTKLDHAIRPDPKGIGLV